MTRKIGRNRNSNEAATLSDAIALNATTSTTIQAANAKRIGLKISNPSNKDVWVKYQAASVDNDMKGEWLPKNSVHKMDTDNVYTGEISAISASGTPDVYVTEY